MVRDISLGGDRFGDPGFAGGQSINNKTRNGVVPSRLIGYPFYDNGVGPIPGIPQVSASPNSCRKRARIRRRI
jgi:hypothetical protein